jgi:hypothetical protein
MAQIGRIGKAIIDGYFVVNWKGLFRRIRRCSQRHATDQGVRLNQTGAGKRSTPGRDIPTALAPVSG